MKKPLLALVMAFALLVPTSALASPKAGASCSKAGSASTYAGKKYTCIKSGKKLVWNKGVAIAKPTPSPSPSASPSASPTPTTTSIPIIFDIDHLDPTLVYQKSRETVWNIINASSINTNPFIYYVGGHVDLSRVELEKISLMNAFKFWSSIIKPKSVQVVFYDFQDLDWAVAKYKEIAGISGIDTASCGSNYCGNASAYYVDPGSTKLDLNAPLEILDSNFDGKFFSVKLKVDSQANGAFIVIKEAGINKQNSSTTKDSEGYVNIKVEIPVSARNLKVQVFLYSYANLRESPCCFSFETFMSDPTSPTPSPTPSPEGSQNTVTSTPEDRLYFFEQGLGSGNSVLRNRQTSPHEYTHLAQAGAASNYWGAAPWWALEGMASFYGEAIGYQSFDKNQEKRKEFHANAASDPAITKLLGATLKSLLANNDKVLTVSLMGKTEKWDGNQSQLQSQLGLTYLLGSYACEVLAAVYGQEKINMFMKSFTTSDDWAKNFQNTFGISKTTFYEKLTPYLYEMTKEL